MPFERLLDPFLMARQPRIALAGRPHVLIQTTAAEAVAFVDDPDRRCYVDAMHECARGTGVAVHAYALGQRRACLMATPETADALGRFMQRLGRRYVVAFNRRRKGTGPLWNSRFASAALLTEHFLLSVLLTTEQLPVRDGCAVSAGEWAWSSAAHHLGIRPDARLVDPACYWSLGNTPFERQARYAALLSVPVPEGQALQIETAARRGWPLGAVEDVDRLQVTGLHRAMRPRPPGRPRRID